ncbi:MAG: Uncharacterised protein [Opitutia bacterium UBA7350]|nr:MAG: Uncharacterised protein [Opitutae bacterium UBA7350]
MIAVISPLGCLTEAMLTSFYTKKNKAFVNFNDTRQKSLGFTLIELLVVISVVGILVSITFGVSRGVKSAQSRALAKAELSVLAQALEQYKSRYGDYPWHDFDDGDYPTPEGGETTNAMLLYALTGRMDMKRVPSANGGTEIRVSKVSDQLDNAQVIANPQFIETSKFSVSGDVNEPNQLLDPWGNPYIYNYKLEEKPNDWEVFGYHLYSTGPDSSIANDTIKEKIEESTGVLDRDFRETANAAGIIFAGE